MSAFFEKIQEIWKFGGSQVETLAGNPEYTAKLSNNPYTLTLTPSTQILQPKTQPLNLRPKTLIPASKP
jgi:hypothetical protein